MKKQEIVPKSVSTPLPLIVADKWEFKLNFHIVEGEHFYAIPYPLCSRGIVKADGLDLAMQPSERGEELMKFTPNQK